MNPWPQNSHLDRKYHENQNFATQILIVHWTMFVWMCPLDIFKQIWHDLWIYSNPYALWKQNRSLIPNLWGRHWRHSFSWNPSNSIVLNFFPHPLHTFVWEEFSCQEYAQYVADETYKQIEEENQKNQQTSWNLMGESMSGNALLILAILKSNIRSILINIVCTKSHNQTNLK